MIFEFIVIFILLFIIIGLVYQFMYDIYLWVLLISLTFYICYVAVKLVYSYTKKIELTIIEKTPMQTAMSQKEKVQDKDLERLKDFIQKNLKQGFKAERIKEALIKEGWPKEKVEQAFK
ncbi:MAG: hypothetical protein Q8R18_04045 [bacterium]|nr:hypothetical protein [bacterium]